MLLYSMGKHTYFLAVFHLFIWALSYMHGNISTPFFLYNKTRLPFFLIKILLHLASMVEVTLHVFSVHVLSAKI